MELGGGGWGRVEVDGAGWRWVHGLVIPIQKINRRITLVFHYFAFIEKSANNLFGRETQKTLIKQ